MRDDNLKMYSARVMFKRTPKGEKTVTVQIRYTKKGSSPVKKFSFPEYIKEEELNSWVWYHGEQIAVYHRRDAHNFVDSGNVSVPSKLSHNLERLVREVQLRNISKNVKNTEADA